MKKLFTLVAVAFMAIGANAQAIIYEHDFTGGFEGDYPYWSQFDASQTDAGSKITSDADGIAITVASQTGQLWQPQVEVTPLGAFDIYQFDNYKIVITAKYPTDGQVQLQLGNWSGNFQEAFAVTSTGDFQTDEFVYSDPAPADYEKCHMLFQCGDFLGTTILKKFEIWDLDAEPDDATAIKTLKNKAQKNVRYNLAGQQVDANYKGAVIMNGKKFIQK